MLVDIVAAFGSVRDFVMRDEVDFVLSEKLVVEHPGCVDDDLVDVPTMANAFVAFSFVHDGLALLAVRQIIVANADEKVYVLEDVLRLHQLSSVTGVKQIVNA